MDVINAKISGDRWNEKYGNPIPDAQFIDSSYHTRPVLLCLIIRISSTLCLTYCPVRLIGRWVPSPGRRKTQNDLICEMKG